MASLFRSVRKGRTDEQRSIGSLSFDQWSSFFGFNSLQYPYTSQGSLSQQPEEFDRSFAGYVEGIYHRNGVVFACMAARQRLFSEARFQFRALRNGRPGDLFGNADLAVLESPWPNGTTGDLLSRMIQDVDLAGNAYIVRDRSGLHRLRPDWVNVISGSKTSDDPNAFDTEILGYVYHPNGTSSKVEPVLFMPEQVAHWAPTPDPARRFLGMSWVTPVVREILADGAATTHKLKFFENGATPNLVMGMDPDIKPETFERYVKMFRESEEGLDNAYKTLFTTAANVQVVGADLRQIDFKVTQGAGETRIAAAAGVPPIIVGLSEGLQAATYSNYGQARRHFADGTLRPLWRSAAAALDSIVKTPGGAHLWYDDRDIPFLQEDEKDAADIQSVKAGTVHNLITAGYEPDSVIKAVEADDLSLLTHSGMYSVQLVPAGAVGEGKGSIVSGTAVPAADKQKQLPAKTGRAADDLLAVL